MGADVSVGAWFYLTHYTEASRDSYDRACETLDGQGRGLLDTLLSQAFQGQTRAERTRARSRRQRRQDTRGSPNVDSSSPFVEHMS